MALYVKCTTPQDRHTGVTDHASWCVLCQSWPDVILWGFARKLDAEIAMEFMNTLPVNWDESDEDEFGRQLAVAGYPKEGDLMKACCERLQW